MTILIVDDSATSRLVLSSLLDEAGYKDILQAGSPHAAFDILEKDSVPSVDLILMDIVMPGMDGITATKRLKSDERFRDIPIIMVTVRDEEESLAKAFDAGAIDFISKPANKVELRTRVRSVLRLKQEIDNRKAREREKEQLIEELRDALSKVRMLSGLLPICSVCKKIRDDKGYWNQIESFLLQHTEAEFSHSYCPECARKICDELE